MSITYEDALATLNSMFGDRWDTDELDTVLRHFEGHMENTIESILGHGEGEPSDLITKLQSGLAEGSTIDSDAEIARQLAAEDQRRRSTRDPPATRRNVKTPVKKGMGTPTELPSDFLRIPGHSNDTSSLDSDEQLARMLQDELLQKELRNNKEFAHLANGGQSRPGSLVNEGPDLIDKIGGETFTPNFIMKFSKNFGK